MFDAHIGNTPIVKLAKVTGPEMAEVWIKLEGQNPAGSIKDRTALGMIQDAEERGILTPGSAQTIIEPTSGNTGIGLAFLSAVRGYRCIIVLPDSMSMERQKTLEAYGAELVFTPGEERMQGAIPRAQELAEEMGAWMPSQFDNPANPRYQPPRHRTRAVAADAGAHRRFRVGVGNGRLDQRRRALPQGAESRYQGARRRARPERRY